MASLKQILILLLLYSMSATSERKSRFISQQNLIIIDERVTLRSRFNLLVSPSPLLFLQTAGTHQHRWKPLPELLDSLCHHSGF